MNKNIVSIADNLIRRLVSIVLQMLPKEIKKIAGSYLANIKSNTLKFIKNHAAIQYENMNRNKARRSATGNSTNTEDICPLPWELDEFISQTSIYLLDKAKAANILDIHNDVNIKNNKSVWSYADVYNKYQDIYNNSNIINDILIFFIISIVLIFLFFLFNIYYGK